MAPELAVADGAYGFWQAVEEVLPALLGGKIANDLNKLPKSQRPKPIASGLRRKRRSSSARSRQSAIVCLNSTKWPADFGPEPIRPPKRAPERGAGCT
jgi:hypothetical protein